MLAGLEDTYFTVSLLFWYMGMIPDLATLRDRATGRLAQVCYGLLALGCAQFGPALAAIRDGLPFAGRPGNAAGHLGAFGGEFGFRHLDSPFEEAPVVAAAVAGKRYRNICA